MQEDTNLIEPLYQRIEEYGKTSYVLFKLRALEKATGIVSTYALKSLLIAVFAMALIFLSIGASLCLGDLFGKAYYGFICVSGLYCIAGLCFYFFMSTYIKKKVMNSIISKMLDPAE